MIGYHTRLVEAMILQRALTFIVPPAKSENLKALFCQNLKSPLYCFNILINSPSGACMYVRRFCCAFLVMVTISSLIVAARCETLELVKNGGFEDGLNYWKSQGFKKCSVNATVTSLQFHSGKHSLDTATGDGNEGCNINTAYQSLTLPQRASDLRFSFWFHSNYVGDSSVSLETEYQFFLAIVAFQTTKGLRFLVYHTFWDPRHSIRTDFPPAGKSSENVTNILISGLKPNQWNNVERDLTEDLRKNHPGIRLEDVKVLSVQLFAGDFRVFGGGGRMNPVHTYWDDISLTCKVSAPTQTPTITPTPTPKITPQTPTSTPTPTPTVTPPTAAQTTIEQYILPIALIGAATIALAALLHRRRASKASTHAIAKPPIVEESVSGKKELAEYCYHCGATMPSGAKFCKKCGKSQT